MGDFGFHRMSSALAGMRHPRQAGGCVGIAGIILVMAGVRIFAADAAPDGAGGAAATRPAAASATAAEIELQRKLDQPFDLTLSKVELSEAFKQIAATAQIALQVDPACYDALPYGATIKVTADFRQSKLRAGLEQVLIPLSLQQTVSGATVVIRPSGPLARIGRRADWDELKLLDELRTSPDLKLPAGGEFDWTTGLRGVLEKHSNLVIVFAGEGNGVTRAAQEKAMEQLKKQMPLSAFRALEVYCELTNQIWFVESGAGGTIRVMPVRMWIDRQMERPVQLAFTNAPLDQVVAELSHVSGIRFTPEPGLYKAVPIVSLTATNCSVRQALETLSGVTRIAFDVREDSVLLHMAGNSPVAPVAARVDPYVGHFNLPMGNGMTVDMVVHESDLTPELREIFKKRMAEALARMEKELTQPTVTIPATEPGVATTGPATQPEKK